MGIILYKIRSGGFEYFFGGNWSPFKHHLWLTVNFYFYFNWSNNYITSLYRSYSVNQLFFSPWRNHRRQNNVKYQRQPGISVMIGFCFTGDLKSSKPPKTWDCAPTWNSIGFVYTRITKTYVIILGGLRLMY